MECGPLASQLKALEEGALEGGTWEEAAMEEGRMRRGHGRRACGNNGDTVGTCPGGRKRHAWWQQAMCGSRLCVAAGH
eukprot:74700-Chlamydomonas_euryale.AAC.2